MFTALVFISGIMYSGISYYARAEAKEMIKAELAQPLKEMNEVTEKLNSQLDSIQKQQIQNETKIQMMIELMQKNNNLITNQTKTIEELKK